MKARDQDAGPPLDLTSICACVLADETFRGWTAAVPRDLLRRMGGVECLGTLQGAVQDQFRRSCTLIRASMLQQWTTT